MNDPDAELRAKRKAKEDRRYKRAVAIDEGLAKLIRRCTMFCGSPRSECPCPQAQGRKT